MSSKKSDRDGYVCNQKYNNQSRTSLVSIHINIYDFFLLFYYSRQLMDLLLILNNNWSRNEDAMLIYKEDLKKLYV